VDVLRGTVLRLAGAATVAVALTGCLGGLPSEPAPGQEARLVIESAAQQLGKKLGYRNRVRDAEYIAATEIPAVPHDDTRVGVTPLAWSGQTTRAELATIDVRFTASALEPSVSPSGHRVDVLASATVCFRYTLQLYRDTSHQEIDCPAVATPPVPSASPVLVLPADAEERLSAALRTATAATLASVVRAAFPQDGITVDTIDSHGTLVAAVGVPAERDCIVMIRTPDGEMKRISFGRIQLEPGESGCHTTLYTNPVR
jgi:hypothetical protein